MPKLKELQSRYQDQGLVLIGVHTTNGGQEMADYAKEKEIGYPIAIDVKEKTKRAFAVDSYPDYYLIDRAGKLRVADLANSDLERAVEILLAEGGGAPDPLAEARTTAKKKDIRILVVWGTEDESKPVHAALKKDRELARFVDCEFEMVSLLRAQHGELAAKQEAGNAGLALSVLDAAGHRLATVDAQRFISEGDLDAIAFRGFLEQHRIPQKNAVVLWSKALAQAEKENKRVLVHLGAPW